MTWDLDDRVPLAGRKMTPGWRMPLFARRPQPGMTRREVMIALLYKRLHDLGGAWQLPADPVVTPWVVSDGLFIPGWALQGFDVALETMRLLAEDARVALGGRPTLGGVLQRFRPLQIDPRAVCPQGFSGHVETQTNGPGRGWLSGDVEWLRQIMGYENPVQVGWATTKVEA
jgi:hypothetical protein